MDIIKLLMPTILFVLLTLAACIAPAPTAVIAPSPTLQPEATMSAGNEPKLAQTTQPTETPVPLRTETPTPAPTATVVWPPPTFEIPLTIIPSPTPAGLNLPGYKHVTWRREHEDPASHATIEIPESWRLWDNSSVRADDLRAIFGNPDAEPEVHGGAILKMSTEEGLKDIEERHAFILENIGEYKDVSSSEGEIGGLKALIERATYVTYDSQELTVFVLKDGFVWRISCYAPVEDKTQIEICENVVKSLRLE